MRSAGGTRAPRGAQRPRCAPFRRGRPGLKPGTRSLDTQAGFLYRVSGVHTFVRIHTPLRLLALLSISTEGPRLEWAQESRGPGESPSPALLSPPAGLSRPGLLLCPDSSPSGGCLAALGDGRPGTG